jgi:hypothetical protein
MRVQIVGSSLVKRLLADAALRRRVNDPFDVFVEQKALPMQVVRGPGHGAHVGPVVCVSLLDREPRVAGSQSLGLCLGELDLLAECVS